MYRRLSYSSITLSSSEKSRSHFSNSPGDPISRPNNARYSGSACPQSLGSNTAGTNDRGNDDDGDGGAVATMGELRVDCRAAKLRPPITPDQPPPAIRLADVGLRRGDTWIL